MLQKYNGTLVGNYAVANGLPNRIPNKGHLNLPCFAWHAEDGSTTKKNTTTAIMKWNILVAAMFS
jgi:hypothetical protein